MGATKNLYDAIPAVRFNPSAVLRLGLAMVEEKLDGKFDLVDPTNPFMMLAEANATMASAAMTDGEAVLRKMYESMSLDEDELYLHMSDRDYLDRFASPSRATISLFLAEEDVIRYAEQSEIGNYRKIVIPKHTQIVAGDIPFTMQYAIEIRIKPHGGYDVVYNVEDVSPVETLTSNVVDWKISSVNGRDFFRLNIPMRQMLIQSIPGQMTDSTNFKKTFVFKDQFYYARAYRVMQDGSWSEMRTTHTDQVFDPRIPTAVFQVVGNTLTVSIPQVYLRQGQLDAGLRIDIYTTRGEMDVDLNSLNPNAFSMLWRDLDGNVDKKYYASIPDMELTVTAMGATVGGKNRLTFEQLRDRVMTNSAGSINLPITNVQVTSYLENLGYSTVTDVDNVTNRNFLATRLLPIPEDGPVVSSAGLAVETLSITMEKLAEVETVVDNGERLTILPSTVYTTRTGVTEIVPKSYIDSLKVLPYDLLVEQLNQENFSYTPFHYVLDTNNDRFETRPYYLDNPQITDKNFIADNDTVGMSVSTRRYSLERIPTGYRLFIEVNGDATWNALPDDQCICQLAFRPETEIDLAHMNGTLYGMLNGNRVYQFDIETNYDIDESHLMALTSFSMYHETPRDHYTPLKAKFYLIYAASYLSVAGLTPSVIDIDLNKANLPSSAIGITEESFDIQLGSNLEGLWNSSRSLPSSLDYRRYDVDVPALYEQTVYERDETGAKVWTNDGGNITFSVLHAIGDPILDQDDNPTYKFRIGDVMLDVDGNPIVENTRKMLRQTDIVTVDGLYYFVTEFASKTYRDLIAKLITEWVSVDIVKAQAVLLEQSKLYFYPKVTLGYVDAWVLDNKQVRIRSSQSFKVTLYVNASVYRDASLRVSLTVAARTAINDVLQNAVVTSDAIVDSVRERVGADVIGLSVTGLGGADHYDTISMVDNAARLSMGKRAIAHADGSVGVEDSVDVIFIRHSEE